MTDDFGFFLGDIVYVKPSHPFVGTSFKTGEIKSFLTTEMAMVQFPEALHAVDEEKLESFESDVWCIPLEHLERIRPGESVMNCLLENTELKQRLQATENVLELSEALRQQQAKQLKGVLDDL